MHLKRHMKCRQENECYRWEQTRLHLQGSGGQQAEPRQAVEATHREWCAGTSCPWSPAGAYGPGSPSETAGWGSDANQYSTPYLEEEKKTSGSIQLLNHVGGHLHSFTSHPHWWFDFEAIKKGIQKFEFLTSYTALLRRATKHATSLESDPDGILKPSKQMLPLQEVVTRHKDCCFSGAAAFQANYEEALGLRSHLQEEESFTILLWATECQREEAES